MVEGDDGFEDVDDGGAGADADVGGGRGEVVAHGEAGGVAFGGFHVHGGGWWGWGRGRGSGSGVGRWCRREGGLGVGTRMVRSTSLRADELVVVR